MLSGAVAQYGRGVGMIEATAGQIIGQFAANLRTQFTQPQSSVPPTAAEASAQRPPSPPQNKVETAAATARPQQSPPPLRAAKPISGLSLMARVIWQQITGLFTGRRH
jgi:uncharacterized protein